MRFTQQRAALNPNTRTHSHSEAIRARECEFSVVYFRTMAAVLCYCCVLEEK